MARLTKKEIEKFIADRTKRNAAFAKMSLTQKRITVARDVLEMLATKRIKATAGTYFAPTRGVTSNAKAGDDFSDLIAKIPSCDACAIGSLFMAGVCRADQIKVRFDRRLDIFGAPHRRWNDVDVSKTMDGNDVFLANEREYLVELGLFSKEQLALMENAFENSGYDVANLTLGRVRYDRDRLRLIMQNIVRNRGVFKPRDRKMLRAAKRRPQTSPDHQVGW